MGALELLDDCLTILREASSRGQNVDDLQNQLHHLAHEINLKLQTLDEHYSKKIRKILSFYYTQNQSTNSCLVEKSNSFKSLIEPKLNKPLYYQMLDICTKIEGYYKEATNVININEDNIADINQISKKLNELSIYEHKAKKIRQRQATTISQTTAIMDNLKQMLQKSESLLSDIIQSASPKLISKIGHYNSTDHRSSSFSAESTKIFENNFIDKPESISSTKSTQQNLIDEPNNSNISIINDSVKKDSISLLKDKQEDYQDSKKVDEPSISLVTPKIDNSISNSIPEENSSLSVKKESPFSFQVAEKNYEKKIPLTLTNDQIKLDGMLKSVTFNKPLESSTTVPEKKFENIPPQEKDSVKTNNESTIEDAYSSSIIKPDKKVNDPQISCFITPNASKKLLEQYESNKSSTKIIWQKYSAFAKNPNNDSKNIAATKKFINISINTLSRNSGQEIIKRARNFVDMLNGNAIQTSQGNIHLSDSLTPDAKYYATFHLFKSIHSQIENIISVSNEAAFPVSVLVKAIFKSVPNFFENFKCFFQYKFPLMMVEIPKIEEIVSIKEINETLNLEKYDESQKNHFLEIICKQYESASIFISLTASIMLPSALETSHINPNFFGYIWSLLSFSLKSMKNNPDIGICIAYGIIKYSGSSLAHIYGRQFSKLLRSLQKFFVSGIDEFDVNNLSSSHALNCKIKLEDLCHHFMTNQSFPNPEGSFDANFWKS